MIKRSTDARWQFFITNDAYDDEPHLWLVCGECSLSDGIGMEPKVSFDLGSLESTIKRFKTKHRACRGIPR